MMSLRSFFGWTFLLITLSASYAFGAVPVKETAMAPKSTSFTINKIQWDQLGSDYILKIEGDSSPTYTMYELFEPMRVIIDIADAAIDSMVNLPFEIQGGPVSFVNGKMLDDQEPFIARIEIYITNESTYSVERSNNDIIVTFANESSESSGQEAVINTPKIPPVDPEIKTETMAGNDKIQSLPSGDFVDETTITVSDLITTTTLDTIAGIEATVESIEINTKSEENISARNLFNIEINHQPNETLLMVKADGPIQNFNEILLGEDKSTNKPNRLFLDLDNITLVGPEILKESGTALARVRLTKKLNGSRIILDSGLDTLFEYSIQEQTDGLLITIKEPSATTSILAGIIEKTEQTEVFQNSQDVAALDTPKDQDSLSAQGSTSSLPSNGIESDSPEPEQPQIDSKSPATKSADDKTQKKDNATSNRLRDFSFAGYNKKRITVDFFKIDLHNVFRLFGEVSNLNIVVDESVGGTLTLALNDVPWDFALDIILNLKDLQKEERFNTIVISPKSKKFTWPERSLDTLEFKADLDVLEVQAQDAIKISKRQEIPETVIEAKKLIHQAQSHERAGNYQAALPLYEEAFKKWSDNILLARRIATLCLVHINSNAKAIHYSKTALQLNPGDTEAALLTAIGLARMQKKVQAKEYFDLAVSGSKPSSDALASYSAFCEENGDFDCSMTLLKKHEDLHGDTLETMISRARIFDKQGDHTMAINEYQAILLSGFSLPGDLKRFIQGRLAVAVMN
ncbi:MAG: AMIN domain-containing protein [Proteobacteria bacterium]|nr:AMIN domain-containing protein [Pseudomonadota bacterium]MBU1687548.1 AMIN domain-containing protein [Pseudomonadota bacterium]